MDIIVIYDRGAAGATEIIDSLRAMGRVLFVVQESDHTKELYPLLRELVEVIHTEGDVEETSREILRRATPEAVVTYSERMLRFTSALAARLGLRSHSPGVAEVLTNKLAQRSRLAESTVDTIRFAVLDDPGRWHDILEYVGLPAVVKPLTGEGSRDVHLLSDATTAHRTLPALLRGRPGEFLLEEFLVGTGALAPFGDYVSVETVVSRGRIRHIAVTGKFPLAPPFRECGQFWPSTLSPVELDEVRGLTERALRALGVEVGLTHTEIKLTGSGPRIIEVNGRLGGWMNDLGLRSGTGDLISMAVLAATGQHPPEPPATRGVYYQYSNPSPITLSRLTRVEGAGAVLGASGVAGYRGLIRAGSVVGGRVDTNELDILFGQSASHEDMVREVSAAISALCFEFKANGHTIGWRPTSLGAIPPL
jgi:biotin carboxylase